MDSTSSTAALNNFLDDLDDANPPFLSCKNCVCQDYTPDPAAEEVSVRIKLCDLHKSNLHAPNPAPARPFNSPAQPITVPGANRALPPGRRIGDDDDQQNAPNAVVVDIPTPPLDFRHRLPLPYDPALLGLTGRLLADLLQPDRDHHLDDPSHLTPPQLTEDEELHLTYPLTPLPHTSESSGSAMIPLTEERRSQTYWKRRTFPDGRGIGSALSPSCRCWTPPSSTRFWRKLCLGQILTRGG